MEIKLYILNRRGGLRPEGGRFFTLRRLVDAPVLKKNREKNEGKTKTAKKPIRIKKPYGGGGDENGKKPIGIKKPYGGGGVKRLAGGMGVVGWRIQHNEFTVLDWGALKTHTLEY